VTVSKLASCKSLLFLLPLRNTALQYSPAVHIPDSGQFC